jgi:oxygen-independent coproporphyrinogen-3 oxidase
MEKKSRHIYVHIPFCEVICHYCDFYTARASEANHLDFFSALSIEAEKIIPLLDKKISALYLGGGTPSVSPIIFLEKFLSIFKNHIDQNTEITIEANPTNIKKDTASDWGKIGINRISIGIQSLDDKILKKLGRVHTAKQALNAIDSCLKFVPNVSGDLIYAVPEQEEIDPANHALEMANIGVSHFSAYHLTLNSNHFLHPKLPTDSFAFNQLKNINDLLSPKGYRHYEISNFGRPGFESKNNLNYWHGGPYLALGPSAHGFDGNNKRWQNISDWRKYIKNISAGISTQESIEQLSLEQRKIEAIFTGLRLEEGLNLHEIENRYSCQIIAGREQLFSRWQIEGLGKLDNGWFKPTFKGRMLADEIAQKLL